MGIFSRLFGSSKPAPTPAKTDSRAAARSPVVTVTTRHENEVDQPWRTGERFVSEFSIAGVLAGSSTIEMSAGPGFLGLSGESHYQDALKAAKQSTAEFEPTFEATLVAEPSNEFDPNAVAVIIAPFGKVGYVPKAAAERFQKIVRTSIWTEQSNSIGKRWPSRLRRKCFPRVDRSSLAMTPTIVT